MDWIGAKIGGYPSTKSTDFGSFLLRLRALRAVTHVPKKGTDRLLVLEYFSSNFLCLFPFITIANMHHLSSLYYLQHFEMLQVPSILHKYWLLTNIYYAFPLDQAMEGTCFCECNPTHPTILSGQTRINGSTKEILLPATCWRYSTAGLQMNKPLKNLITVIPPPKWDT